MQSMTGHWAGYHYFIDKAGVVTQTRYDDEEGAHTIGYNTQSLGICLAGNFDATKPTEAQAASLKSLLASKSAQYAIHVENIVPHRKFASKTCYGKNLSNTWAADLLAPAPTMPTNDNAAILAKAAALLSEALQLLQTLK